jgi:hypothetical protein
MKRTYIKKVIADIFKKIDEKGYKKSEIMELSLKTCIDKEATLFVRADAVINEEGEKGKSFKVRIDFDL